MGEVDYGKFVDEELNSRGARSGAVGPDPISAAADAEVTGLHNELWANAQIAVQQEPDEFAQLWKVGRALGLDPLSIAGAEDHARNVASINAMGLPSVAHRTPRLAGWLSKLENMQLSHDDLKRGNLQQIADSWMNGVDTVRFGERALDAMGKGLDPTIDPETLRLKGRIESSARAIEASRRPLKTVLKGVQVLPGMGTALATGLGVGAVAGATAVGSGAEPLVPVAIGGGTALGSAYSTARQEAGASYYQYVEEMRARGGAVDLAKAKAAATVVGAINGIVEIGGFAGLVTFMPGLKMLVPAERVALQQSLRKIVGKAVLGYGAELVSESVQEGVQQVVTDVGQNVALGDQTDFAGELESFGSTALQSVEAFALAGAVGGGVSLHQQVANRNAGVANEAIFNKYGRLIAESKLATRSSEKLGEIADLAVEDGHPSTVYLGTDEFNKLFQENLPPAEAAEQLGVGDEYKAAIAEGADIAIPFKTYASKIANTTYHAQLEGDLKFAPEDMTRKEREAFDLQWKVLQRQMEEVKAGTDKLSDSPAYAIRFRQLMDTGKTSEKDAEFNAKLHAAFVETMGERSGVDVLEKFPLVVTTEAKRPDALPVNLEQAARAVTQSPEFKTWFSGSAAVDPSGAPLVLYHGTRQEFAGQLGTTYGELGLHFTIDPNVAALVNYSDTADVRYGSVPPSRTYAYFANMKNPLRLTDNGFWGANNVVPQLVRMGLIKDRDVWTDWLLEFRTAHGAADAYGYKEEQRLALQGLIKSLGYDGIVYLNRHEIADEQGAPVEAPRGARESLSGDAMFQRRFPDAKDSYIAFSDAQIRNAIGDPDVVLGQEAQAERPAILGRSVHEIRSNIGEGRLVVGDHKDGQPLRMADGKEFLEANLDEAGDGWAGTDAGLQAVVTRSFGDAVRETSRGQEVVDSLETKMEPKPAAFWHRALQLPNRARYWYEISAEYFKHVLSGLSAEELTRFIDVVAATSPQADPNLNIARAVGAFSEAMAHVPVATDVISPTSVGQALSGVGLEGAKTRSFSGAMQYILGLSKERPLSTNDRQVAASFGLDPNTIGSNPVLYEVLSRFYINMRDALNSSLPKGHEPYQTWQIQAMGWVQERYESDRRTGAGVATTSDDYQQALGKVLGRLAKAGVDVSGGKLSVEALMGEAVPNALSRTREAYLDSPIATIEIQTLLTEHGPAIKDAVERARAAGDINSLNEFDSITKRAFSSLGKRAGKEGSLAERIATAVKGAKVSISRVVNGLGTYEGAVGANIRIPVSELSDADIEAFLSLIGEAWHQGAMAASSFRSVPDNDPTSKPWPGFVRTYQIFLENRVALSNEEIAAFSRALGGNELNVNPNVANGVTVDINPAFGEDGPVGPDPDVVVAAAEKVFGAHTFETFPKNYKSTYIDRSEYAAKGQAHGEAKRSETVDAIVGKSGLDRELVDRYVQASAPAASRKLLERAAAAGARAGSRRSRSLTPSESARAEKLKAAYRSRSASLESLKAEAAKILTDYERALVSTWKPKADKRFERSQRELSEHQEANLKADEAEVAGVRLFQPARGDITLMSGGEPYVINLGETADKSTFLHESGHMFLDVMSRLATADGATEQIVSDYETTLKWLGYESNGDRINSLEEMAVLRRGVETGTATDVDVERLTFLTEREEKWARGFEAFLFEGKAPAPGLIRAFTRFARWLSSIYKKIEALRVEVPQDIKDVMSRMIAADEQISAVEEHDKYIPMFENAAEAGMTEEKFKAYQNLAEEAHWEAYRQVDLKIRSEQEREARSWWKEERAKTIEEVTEEVDAKPSVQAQQFLRDGSIPPGLESNRDVLYLNGVPLKLSTSELDRMYGTMSRAIKRKLGPGAIRTEGGVHPDAIAQIFGFKSGDEMVRALIGQDSRARQIAAETKRRMAVQYGDILNDGTIESVARGAVHDSGKRLQQLQAELDALNRQAGHRVVKLSRSMLSAYADQQIAKSTVRAIEPHRYLQAERKAATEAIKATGKGKYDEAVDWQKKRMINRFLYGAAVEAKRKADAAARFLKKQDTTEQRAKLGKMDTVDPVTGEATHSYLDQQDKLLERFDFRRISGPAARARESLAAWIATETDAGRDPVIAPKLIDEATRKNWQDMVLEDLLDLADSVRTIKRQADRKNKILVAGKELMFDSVVEEGVAQVQLNAPIKSPTQVSENNKTWAQRTIYDTLRRADAELVRLREIANELDGDDPNGLFHRVLIHPLDDAAAADHELNVKTTKLIDDAIQRLPKAMREQLSSRETIYIPSIKQSVLFSDLIAFGLNMGNESNKYKMLAGWQTERQGNIPWTETTMSEMRSQLKEEHWDFIQEVWDALETLWPAASALEKRLTGLAPKKIEAAGFDLRLPDGTTKAYRGGYYPVIYDPRFSGRNLTDVGGQGAGLYDKSHDRAVTPHGHLIDRIETYARPISLKLERVLGNVASVIHDATHRESLLEAYRFLTDQRVADALVRHMGEEYYRMMLERVRRVANNRNQPSAFMGAVHRVQGAVSASMMGFKMSVSLQNFANVILAKQAVGTLSFARAAVQFAAAPLDSIKTIHEASSVMRHRMDQRDNELRQVFEETISLTASRAKFIRNQVMRVGYRMMAFTNAVTEYPAWLAAFQNAQKDGLLDEEAVRAADDVLLSTFGGGSVKDLALVQDTEAMRPFTMFYGFFSAVYNMTRRAGRQTTAEWRAGKRASATAHALEYLLWNIVVMNVLSEIFSGRPPDDDDLEDAGGLAEWVAAKGASYTFAMVPFVRDIYRAIEGNRRDVSLTPLSSALTEFARIGQEVSDAGMEILESDDLDMDQVLDSGTTVGLQVAKTAGIFSGLPVSQATITGGYLWDLLTDKDSPETWSEGLHNLFYKRRKKAS